MVIAILVSCVQLSYAADAVLLPLDNVVQVAAGGDFSMALRADGTVWTWGNNAYKQLGLGPGAALELVARKVPTLDSVKAIAAGLNHAVAVKDDGTVWVWGTAGYGGDYSDVPKHKNNVHLQNIVAVSAGANHVVALRGDGTLWAWGKNNYSQLGNGFAADSWTPVSVRNIDSVVAIATGQDHNLALRSDGSVWSWGHNGHGQLGDGKTTNSSSVIKLNLGVSMTAIGTGRWHSFAITDKGDLYGWGKNAEGQLGFSSTAIKEPRYLVNTPLSLAVSGGADFTILTSNTGLWSWGKNGYGQLGNDLTGFVPPTLTSINAGQIACGSYHSLGISPAGIAYAWGRNNFSQLGRGSATPSQSGDAQPVLYWYEAPPVVSKPLTITAHSKNKVYGETEPELTYDITSGELAEGDSLTGSLLRTVGESVGVYEIQQGTLTAGSNYDITYVPANLTITKAPLLIGADDISKSYGEADPELTVSYTGFKFVDTEAVVSGLSVARVTGEALGTYMITPISAIAANYHISYATGTLTIDKAALTITADPQTKVYGTTDPVLTYQVSYGSSISDDEITGALTRAVGEDVDTYQIQQGTLAAKNYAITFVPAQLIITAAPLTITADVKNKTYGDADPALTYKVTAGVLITSDLITGSLARATGENVGSYEIQQGSLTVSSNYHLTYEANDLGISKAPLLIQADDKAKAYGEADPQFTVSYTGFKFNDTESTVSGLSIAREAGEERGTYDIAPTGGAAANYDITYSAGTLTIDKAALTITAHPQSKVYGTADPDLTYQITYGSLLSDDELTGTLTRAEGESVGTYQIQQGTVQVGDNYYLTYIPTDLFITTAPLTITANAKSKCVGQSDPDLTYQVSGLVAEDTSSDTITGALARVPGEHVGSYQILIGTLSAGANYNVVYTPANLKIRAIRVTSDPEPPVKPSKALLISEEGEFEVYVPQSGLPDVTTEQITAAKNKGASTIVMSLDGPIDVDANTHTSVLISTSILRAIAEGEKTTLRISSSAASLTLPPTLVSALAAQGQELSIIIHRTTAKTVQADIPIGSTVIGEPVSVQTTIRGATRVTMPMNLLLPTDALERDRLLTALTIFAMHSDGTKQNIYDVVTEVDEITGQHILLSVSFAVDKFSTFALITLTNEPLSTVVGIQSYTIAGVTKDMIACYYKGADTMMPIRMLEHFGVNLDWNEATRTATMSYKQNIVQLTIGSPDAYINGVKTPIVGASGNVVSPELAPGRTMIPLRFVSEKLGFKVTWDPSHLITISP